MKNYCGTSVYVTQKQGLREWHVYFIEVSEGNDL